ncbi:hypothetical protein [Sphingomonas cavernae]|uniref:Uncharacterized protein n=1 Tax=Sphingomonas cavernae TaxID=2320861 RepID=A0A418WP24_9SPHN|nr:hypothetical protein [Sphingomonas cavernae]RJF92988.1 hypothetical protein D3876_00960 [Sphingomonas cavernae]
MKTRMSAYDPETRSVTVTFSDGTISHKRTVNACLDAEGYFDRKATAERVQEVARGVAVKIAAGVVTNPPKPERKRKAG